MLQHKAAAGADAWQGMALLKGWSEAVPGHGHAPANSFPQ